jgi:glycosyltransferase involved in cell wall biosynthesis
MTKSLAIITPQIGAQSETFIRRHIEDLLPGGTVVIAKTNEGPYAGHWDVDCPKLLFNQVHRLGITERALRKIPQKFRPYTAATQKATKVKQTATKQFLQEHQVQVILGEFLDLCLPWLPLANELGIPFYTHAHGYDVSERLKSPEWRAKYQQLNQASGIITINQPSRARLIELGIAPEKIAVIHYGVNVPPQPVTRKKKETVRCLAIGRMVGKKAPILTLDAFRRAAEQCPNLTLDYIGTGPLLPEVKQYIQAFNLGDRVTLHGGQPSELVQKLMQEADIFLQHSMTDPDTGDEEGLPVAILEAMANALPVVSTRHAGIPEAVAEEKTGLLAKEGDSTQMAQNIISLAQNFDARNEMGVAGWQRAKEQFSWKREKELLLKYLQLSP